MMMTWCARSLCPRPKSSSIFFLQRLDHGKGTHVQRRNIRRALDRAQALHADDIFESPRLPDGDGGGTP